MRSEVPHPSVWLDQNVVAQLRTYAAEAERNRILHPLQLDLIYDNKWFKMFVPAQYGGAGMSLTDALHKEESLAYADGSTAWVVTLCAGAGWFIGFIDANVADSIFTNDHVCVAGSGGITGYAEETVDGYVIKGQWKYASGALHATAFTMNCLLTRNGAPIFNTNGSPQIVTVILRSDEVKVTDTWCKMGMIATASHSFEVKNVRVPHERSFVIDAKEAVLKDIIYHYPFLQFAETTLAVNMSGMALRFIDLCEEICNDNAFKQSTQHAGFSAVIRQNKNTLNDLRNIFYNTVAASWKALQQNNTMPVEMCSDVSRCSQQLVQQARTCVNQLYPHCGLTAASTDTEINRVWRNIHTAGQHILFKM
jgi:alkylation response protein AidB-like acyl-CoA dehydrogenase